MQDNYFIYGEHEPSKSRKHLESEALKIYDTIIYIACKESMEFVRGYLSKNKLKGKNSKGFDAKV